VTNQDHLKLPLPGTQRRENRLPAFQVLHDDLPAGARRPIVAAPPAPLISSPMPMPLRLIEEAGGVRMAVKVVPGASRDRIVGVLGDALKVAVSKPPAGGAANAAVIALLADRCGVPRNAIRIVRGLSAPRKEIFIRGLSARACHSKLAGEI
jgi:uncharacterized protein (TIGR00251 family)